MSNPIFGDILHAQSGRRNPGHYIGLSDRECAELDAIADEHDRKMRRLVMERRHRVDRYVDEGIIPEDERQHMYELAEEDGFYGFDATMGAYARAAHKWLDGV